MTLAATRRSVVAGLGATALAGCASAKEIVTGVTGPYAAAADYSASRRGVSLLVMKDGEVLFEHYPAPGGAAQGWELASGTKSFTGIMAAAASADGLLDIDEAAAATLPEWRGDARKSRITLRHLLSLTSGLKIRNAIGRPEPYAQAIKSPAEHEPGQVFEYGPTPFQAFGEIMVRKLKAAGKESDPARWLQARVLDGVGVRPTDWKRGRDGYPFLPQGAHLTARDWARFGQWVMDGGAGVDPKVMAALFEPSAANPGYGLSWWLLRPGLKGPNPRAGVDESTIGEAAMHEDIVMAAGAGDQRLYLLRKRRIVVARQANRIFQSFGPRAVKWRDGDFLRLLPV